MRLSKLCHYFDRSYRDCSYPTPLDVRDEIIHSKGHSLPYHSSTFLPSIDVLDYRGSFLALKLVKDEVKGLGIIMLQLDINFVYIFRYNTYISCWKISELCRS